MRPEEKVTKAVKKFLDKQNLFYWKASDRFTAGIPDIVGCKNGKCFAIELKAPGKKIEPIQQFVLDKMARHGAYTMWADNVADVRRFINGL